MATEFMKQVQDAMKGVEPTFERSPWYNAQGDCLVFHASPEEGYADRVDSLLTLYRSVDADRVIGFEVKDVLAMIKRLGLAGLTVSAESEGNHVHRISIAAILMTAMQDQEEDGEVTKSGMQAYLEAASLLSDAVEVRQAA